MFLHVDGFHVSHDVWRRCFFPRAGDGKGVEGEGLLQEMSTFYFVRVRLHRRIMMIDSLMVWCLRAKERRVMKGDK